MTLGSPFMGTPVQTLWIANFRFPVSVEILVEDSDTGGPSSITAVKIDIKIDIKNFLWKTDEGRQKTFCFLFLAFFHLHFSCNIIII